MFSQVWMPLGVDPTVVFPLVQEKVPKILLVDDDPLFCKAVQKEAGKMHLDLTVCTSMGDLAQLSRRKSYDVAVLDYFFGDGITGIQISHLLADDTPIVLVSNTEGRKLVGERWPEEIRTFLPKTVGTHAILAEALLAAHWPRTVAAELPVDVWPAPAWLPMAAALVTLLALMALYFIEPLPLFDPGARGIQWDQAPVMEYIWKAHASFW